MITIILIFAIVSLLYLLLMTVNADNSEDYAPEQIKPISTRVGMLDITIDPRLELLAVLQYLSGSEMIIPDSDGYAQSIDTWFADFKSHPVLSRLKSLEKHGYRYDLPVSSFLCFDGVPFDRETQSRIGYAKEMDEERLEKATQGGSLEEFYASVNDFVRISDFGGWFESQRPFLEKTVSETASVLASKDDMIRLLIDWYGYEHERYTLVISLLFDGGYGISLMDAQNKNFLYCITCLDGSNNPAHTLLHLGIMIFHEFSHPYVNPLVDEHFDMIKGRAELFEPIKTKMTMLAYTDWWIAVVEHFVRASATRLMQLFLPPEAHEASTQWDINQGFIYMDIVFEAVLEYEQARQETGIRYDEYFPRLMQKFASIKEFSPNDLQDLLGFKGPINFVRMHPIALIYPDPKRVKGVNEFIMPTVDYFVESWLATAYTDTQALELDLSSHNIYTYGAWGTNLWLNKHLAHVPFQILPDKIIANKEYLGTNLRLASCLPNPLNPQLGLAIYTAQNTPAMKGTFMIGPEDWYVYMTNPEPKLLEKGDYSCKTGKWKF